MSTQLVESVRRRCINFWVVVRPAEDVEGQWVAHCLDLDVVTQGNSIAHAFQMAVEAIAMTVAESLELGIDLLSHRAPDQDWEALAQIQREGAFENLSLEVMEARSSEVLAVATQISLEIRSTHGVTPTAVPARWSQPAHAMSACA